MAVKDEMVKVKDVHAATNAILSIKAEMEGISTRLQEGKTKIAGYKELCDNSSAIVGELKTELIANLKCIDDAMKAIDDRSEFVKGVSKLAAKQL